MEKIEYSNKLCPRCGVILIFNEIKDLVCPNHGIVYTNFELKEIDKCGDRK